MPLSWIEALRAYNAGMPSWCVPRKGTPAYDTITKLRRGEKTETPKEIIDRLERKTTGRPKKEKRIVRITLDEPAMETKQEVEVPMAPAESPKKKRVVKKVKVVETPPVPTKNEEILKESVEKKQGKMESKKMSNLLVTLFGYNKTEGEHYTGNAMDIWEQRGDNAVEIARVLPSEEDKYYFYPAVKANVREIRTDARGLKSYATKELKTKVDLIPFNNEDLVNYEPEMLKTASKGLEKMGYELDFAIKPAKVSLENVKDPRIAVLLREDKERKERLERKKEIADEKALKAKVLEDERIAPLIKEYEKLDKENKELRANKGKASKQEIEKIDKQLIKNIERGIELEKEIGTLKRKILNELKKDKKKKEETEEEKQIKALEKQKKKLEQTFIKDTRNKTDEELVALLKPHKQELKKIDEQILQLEKKLKVKK